jgi:two-component system invasion response regulator UvrY
MRRSAFTPGARLPLTKTVDSVLRAVLIASDSLIRIGLKHLIREEYRGTTFGEAATGAEALELYSQHSWDVVILSLSLPDLDGFRVLKEICEMHPETQPHVLAMGMHADILDARRAEQLGASGYLCTSSSRTDVMKAVRSVLHGRQYFSRSAGSEAESGSGLPRASLSAREFEVMLALAQGKRTGEIADELKLNSRTVSTFKRRILNKLHLDSTAQLVRYAVRRELA